MILTLGITTISFLALISPIPFRSKSWLITQTFLNIIENYFLQGTSLWNGLLQIDIFSFYLLIFFSSIFLGIQQIYPNKLQKELYFLLLVMLLAVEIIITSKNLIILFLGLELLNFASYIFLAYAGRASTYLQYFLTSQLSGLFILGGFYDIYLNTGDLSLNFLHTNSNYQIIIGIQLKLGTFPLQNWQFNTYQDISYHKNLIIFFIPKNVYFLLQALFGNILIENNSDLYLIYPLIAIGGISMLHEISIMKFLSYSGMVNLGILITQIPQPIAYWGLLTSYNLAVFLFLWLLTIQNKKNKIEKVTDFIKVPQNLFFKTIFILILLTLSGFPPLVTFFFKQKLTSLLQNKLNTLYVVTLLFLIILSGASYLRVILHILKSDKNTTSMALKNGQSQYITIIQLYLILASYIYYPLMI